MNLLSFFSATLNSGRSRAVTESRTQDLFLTKEVLYH